METENKDAEVIEMERANLQQKRELPLPLQTSPVVRNLFKFLPLKDLVAARKVCSLWNDLATPRVENRIDEFTIDFTNPVVWKHLKLMEQYLKMKEDSKLDFCSFKLGGNIKVGLGWAYKTLFKSFQESITKLELDFEEDADQLLPTTVFRDVLVDKAPFLETLILERLPAQLKASRIFKASESVELELMSLTIKLWYKTEDYSTAFLKDLFKASQKIEELILKSNFDSRDEEEQILVLYMEHSRKELLRKLDLMNLNDGILDLLCRNLTIPTLEVFKVLFIGISVPYQLETFLKAQKDSLKDLNLRFSQLVDSNNGIPLRFPVMKNLKILDLGLDDETFEEIDYGECFPKLEVLNINRPRSERDSMDQSLFSTNSSPCPTVTELELPENLESPMVLLNIARIFPNVLKLNLGAQHGEVLETLWKCWPNMERLAISLIISYPTLHQYSKSLDSVFTGFSETMVGQMSKKLKRGKPLKLEKLEIYREGPSIADLTNLKYLIIHDGPNLHTMAGSLNPKIRLSDVMLLTTLSKLKYVLSVMIAPSTHKFTKDGINSVVNQLELKHFERTIFCHLVKYDWLKVRKLPYFCWLDI